MVHIQPGKPTQNGDIERFNRSQRTEVPDRYVFTSLAEVRRMTEDSRYCHNHHRSHRSLGGLSLVRFAMAQSTATSISD
ncbi:integrase core domain-containing protein [Solimonas flava]|uniref:integrase core domain-containing protein n=1 Tax=Solimonas flava TaxID=415849 RepID=UPI000A03601E|nr:integrase core domain-containing protein [Solimonas flava]